jgi:uroporphyrinogen decarboxylase
MTHRERFLAVYHNQPVDRVPDWEFGMWQQTYGRWRTEGLPELPEQDRVWGVIDGYFHTDNVEYHGTGFGVNVGLLPGFEYQVLEEKGDHIIVRDGDGATAEMIRPELGASIPHYLRYAIETRADWERFREERLQPSAERLVGDLEAFCADSHTTDSPVVLSAGASYGWIRNWMGVENASIAVAEDPEWVGEMLAHLADLKLAVFSHLAGKCRIDGVHWWEDICFNKGPLISPRFFERYMVPQYARVTEFLQRECGCDTNVLDCDGNIHALVPGWIDCGINVMFPVEAAHTDGYRIKAEYGNRVAMRGYVDKHALIAGKEAIDAEMARLKPLLDMGGFVPHTDHLVPPDVSFENYCYYRQKKCELIGK